LRTVADVIEKENKGIFEGVDDLEMEERKHKLGKKKAKPKGGEP